MASVDLSELIPDLEAAVSVPGVTSPFAAASDTEWLTKLRNAFWTAYNEGVIAGWDCDEDGIVSHRSDESQTFGRDLQQLLILYSGINIVQNRLLQLNTVFRAKAGPVEYETQQSAQVLKGLLESMMQEKALILKRLSDLGTVDSFYLDSAIMRDDAIRSGLSYWWGN